MRLGPDADAKIALAAQVSDLAEGLGAAPLPKQS